MNVFISGGTERVGRPLAAHLLARCHRVRVLVRPGRMRWRRWCGRWRIQRRRPGRWMFP